MNAAHNSDLSLTKKSSEAAAAIPYHTIPQRSYYNIPYHTISDHTIGHKEEMLPIGSSIEWNATTRVVSLFFKSLLYVVKVINHRFKKH